MLNQLKIGDLITVWLEQIDVPFHRDHMFGGFSKFRALFLGQQRRGTFNQTNELVLLVDSHIVRVADYKVTTVVTKLEQTIDES